MAYGFSVFWLPLSKALGITKPLACAPDMGFIAQVFSSQCDWPISMLGWIYTLFFHLPGLLGSHLGRLAGACRAT